MYYSRKFLALVTVFCFCFGGHTQPVGISGFFWFSAPGSLPKGAKNILQHQNLRPLEAKPMFHPFELSPVPNVLVLGFFCQSMFVSGVRQELAFFFFFIKNNPTMVGYKAVHDSYFFSHR